jgi:UDP-GlcNAc:undecaprenyl-phosphate GlcNAc-1-phosphate transferase
MIRIPTSLLLAVATALGTLAIVPAVMRLAARAGAIDRPGPRRVHREPVPTMGGLAIAIAFLAVAWLARLISAPAASLDPRPLLGLTLASVPVLMLGIADDTRGVSPHVKLAVQACAAIVLAQFGFGVPLLTSPFGGTIASGWLNVPLTVVWVIAVINAINLIDGLDGLAAGVVTIAAATMWWTGRAHADFYVMFLCALLIGGALGFLRWNFPPARLFMGDTGSHFLGLVLAAAALLENRKGTAAVTLLFPLVALGVPLLDSVLAFVRRLVRGRPVFSADVGHVHHRLLRLGLSPRGALFLLWGLCALCGAAAVALSALPRGTALRATAVLAVLLLAAFEVIAMLDRRRQARGEARDIGGAG